MKVLRFLLPFALLSSCKQTNKSNDETATLYSDSLQTINIEDRVIHHTEILNSNTDTTYFPFELHDFDGQYQIAADIESEELYPKYYDLFKKYGYEGNGYCWEGHIKQILEKLDNKLLNHLDFDPEAGAFFANADSKESQIKFAQLLSPIFSDIKKLEEWVKNADHSRIDD